MRTAVSPRVLRERKGWGVGSKRKMVLAGLQGQVGKGRVRWKGNRKKTKDRKN